MGLIRLVFYAPLALLLVKRVRDQPQSVHHVYLENLSTIIHVQVHAQQATIALAISASNVHQIAMNAKDHQLNAFLVKKIMCSHLAHV